MRKLAMLYLSFFAIFTAFGCNDGNYGDENQDNIPDATLIWKRNFEEYPFNSVHANNSRVFVCANYTLFSLNSDSGNIEWQEDDFIRSFILRDNYIYKLTNSRQIVVLNANDGSRVWESESSRRVKSYEAGYGKAFIVYEYNDWYFHSVFEVVDEGNWNKLYEGCCCNFHDLVCGDGYFFFSVYTKDSYTLEENSNIYALNANTLKYDWSDGSSMVGEPIPLFNVCGSLLFNQYYKGGNIEARSTRIGEIKWVDLDFWEFLNVFSASGRIFYNVLSPSSALICKNSESGSTYWSKRNYWGMCASKNRVFASYDNKIYALDVMDGSPVWMLNKDNSPWHGTCNEKLFFGKNEKTLYAVSIDNQ
ncbi:MAG: PQQ-binding-like beta-propeller repeat protein [Candidatus Coatesbacteria bacterium]|nr:PQQ-binding-like beta-propeller repeat protein [Candidatus Coatesbacteria bacterium]